MNTVTNICNSTMLATAVFWTILISESFQVEIIPFIPLSMIPIFICCSVTISVTICPLFWWFKSPNFTKNQVFQTFFPIYSIVSFALCFTMIVATEFDNYCIAFASAAFISTAQSWIWMTKESTLLK